MYKQFGHLAFICDAGSGDLPFNFHTLVGSRNALNAFFFVMHGALPAVGKLHQICKHHVQVSANQIEEMKNYNWLGYPKSFNELDQLRVLNFESSAPFITFRSISNSCDIESCQFSLVVRHQRLVNTQDLCQSLLGIVLQIIILIFQTKCNKSGFELLLLIVVERKG